MKTLRTRARGFACATAGVAAVEFALIAPLLILFYFGMAETCQLMMAQRRVSHSAAAMADLITQGGELDSAERDDIYKAGRLIMAPFPTDGMRVRITSVIRLNGSTVVRWSEVTGPGMTALPAGQVVPLKTPLSQDGDSVVLAEVQFGYESPVGYVIPGILELKHFAELRPRRTNEVVRCERATADGPCVPLHPVEA